MASSRVVVMLEARLMLEVMRILDISIVRR